MTYLLHVPTIMAIKATCIVIGPCYTEEIYKKIKRHRL